MLSSDNTLVFSFPYSMLKGAKVSEPYASVLSLTIACFGLVVGIYSRIKGKTNMLVSVVIILSFLILTMFVFATMLSVM